MELFLNLVWVGLSAVLALFWLRGSRGVLACSQPEDRRLQILALAMLIIVLLPVISMTDDMQAMSTAEIEHVTRRANLLPVTDQPADPVVPIDTRLFPEIYVCNLQTFARIETSIQNMRPKTGSIRQMAKRPPPFTV